MKSSGLISIFLILASVSLQSCGGKTDQYSGSEKPGTTIQTPNVETELKRAREKLSFLESENQDLKASNKMLSEKLKELQDATENENNDTCQPENGPADCPIRLELPSWGPRPSPNSRLNRPETLRVPYFGSGEQE